MHGRCISIAATIAIGWSAAALARAYRRREHANSEGADVRCGLPTLSAALESYQGGAKFPAEVRKKQAAVLARTKTLPWPDLKKLEERRRLQRRKTPSARRRSVCVAFRPAEGRGGYVVLRPDFETLIYDERDDREVSSFVPVKYADRLAIIVREVENPNNVTLAALIADHAGDLGGPGPTPAASRLRRRLLRKAGRVKARVAAP